MDENPYIVVPLSTDQIKDGKKQHFIATLFISLGGHLKRIHEDNIGADAKEKSMRSIDKIERILQNRFENADKNNKLLKAACPSICTELDVNRLRIFAIIISYLVRGYDRVELSTLARQASLDDTDWPQILELRSLAASLLIDEILALHSGGYGDSEIDPNCTLSKDLIAEVFGGKYAIPFVTNTIITGCRELRKERIAKSKNPTAHKWNKSTGAIVQYLEGIPIMNPAEMSLALERQGYFHQVEGRKQICLAAYRHLARLRKIYIDSVPISELPDKQNVLLIGPTGSGKSYMQSLLFGEILKLPYCMIDMTSFSETGYVGANTSEILPRLIASANGNPDIASLGIICMDEIDKLANDDGRSMVSRQGVQRELLLLLQGMAQHEVHPRGRGMICEPVTKMDTRNLMFIGSGAFAGLQLNNTEYLKSSIGFTDKSQSPKVSPNTTEALIQYGMMPELVGRFHQVVSLHPFNQVQLQSMIENKIIKQHIDDLKRDGIELEVDNGVTALLAKRAIDLGTNGRSIANAISTILTDALFQAYSIDGAVKIRLSVRKGDIKWSTSNRPFSIERLEELPTGIQELLEASC